jgi:hypothetical protein
LSNILGSGLRTPTKITLYVSYRIPHGEAQLMRFSQIPLYVAAGAGVGGEVKVLDAVYGIHTYAFGL